jgi:peptide/nickel transport system permease protein
MGVDGEGTRRRGPWRQAARRFRRRPEGVVALAVVLVLFVIGLLAPLIAPYTVGRLFIELIQNPQPPLSPHHPLGTDVLSRDFATQMLFAIRQTTSSAFICAAGATAIGVTVGATAGYFGGWFGELSTWAMGVVASVPALVVLIIVSIWSRFPVSPIGYGLWLMVLLWTGVARVVGASVASLRHSEFVEAARAAGASNLRILLRHVLPNTSGEVIVAATAVVGQSIVIVATADYLYYAYNQAEKPTLGGLVSDATHSASLVLTHSVALGDIWWLYVFPTVTLVVLLLAVNVLGDALAEALIPQEAARS